MRENKGGEKKLYGNVKRELVCLDFFIFIFFSFLVGIGGRCRPCGLKVERLIMVCEWLRRE